jgi:hypothetical protein
MFSEYRDAVERGEIPLCANDFITSFHRRVFEAVMRGHASEAGFRYEMLGEEFTPDEMGRISETEMSRRQLTQNGPEVFRSAVAVLRSVKEKEDMRGEDLGTRLAYLREKKAKLHKGKVEET